MNIEQAVEKINNKEAKRKDIAQELGMSETTLSRRIKEAGYTYDNTAKIYILGASPKNVRTSEQKNIHTKERKYDTIKEQKQEPTKEAKKKVRKRASFDLDTELLKELKIFAVKADKNAYEVVEQALKEYLRERDK